MSEMTGPRASAAIAFTTDVDGRINSWSREAEELFGHNAEGVMVGLWRSCSPTNPATRHAQHRGRRHQ